MTIRERADIILSGAIVDMDRIMARQIIRDLLAENERLEDKVLRVARGNFAQICSYCGWESTDGGWEELQNHIKICPEHPVSKLKAENERLTTALSGRTYCHDNEAVEARIAELEAERDQLKHEISCLTVHIISGNEIRVLSASDLLDENEQLTADCKAMAEAVVTGHEGYIPGSDGAPCDCWICLIAAKYREG